MYREISLDAPEMRLLRSSSKMIWLRFCYCQELQLLLIEINMHMTVIYENATPAWQVVSGIYIYLPLSVTPFSLSHALDCLPTDSCNLKDVS